jgi:hypothetical protein
MMCSPGLDVHGRKSTDPNMPSLLALINFLLLLSTAARMLFHEHRVCYSAFDYCKNIEKVVNVLIGHDCGEVGWPGDLRLRLFLSLGVWFDLKFSDISDSFAFEI